MLSLPLRRGFCLDAAPFVVFRFYRHRKRVEQIHQVIEDTIDGVLLEDADVPIGGQVVFQGL